MGVVNLQTLKYQAERTSREVENLERKFIINHYRKQRPRREQEEGNQFYPKKNEKEEDRFETRSAKHNILPKNEHMTEMFKGVSDALSFAHCLRCSFCQALEPPDNLEHSVVARH
ncbi:hypothetical protein Q8A73_016021 [Channa argus]|nr:hypothetical protein Q8A73_016021 [Channa argus]